MQGYKIVNLDILLEQLPEEKVKEIIDDFECPLNVDVENFLKYKAIQFSKSSVSKTHLVFASYKDKPVLIAYFALAGNKSFVVKAKSKAISKTLRKRLAKFATYNSELKQFYVPAPLIGQIGKNLKYKDLITGSELLEMACQKIKAVQSEVGGKFVYLECENVPALENFYNANGFITFGVRKLDSDEKDLKTNELLQLLKYL